MDDRYFVLCQNDYITPKNNLHKDVQALFRDSERVIITDRDQFILRLLSAIDALYKKHPRCKKLRLQVSRIKGEYVLFSGVSQLHFYKVRKEVSHG